MFLGLRTVIYPTADLVSASNWYAGILGYPPYFDEPFYVGFNVGGYELGLDPQADPSLGAVSYWGVADIEAAVDTLIRAGAGEHSPVREVGGGIFVAAVQEVGGSILGLIQNPHFELPTATTGSEPGL